MGYTRFSVDNFSSRSCRRETAIGTAAPRFRHARGRSWAKLTLISDFLQGIAVLPSGPLHPKKTALGPTSVNRYPLAASRRRKTWATD